MIDIIDVLFNEYQCIDDVYLKYSIYNLIEMSSTSDKVATNFVTNSLKK